MAKIDVRNNEMTMFMLCEAMSGELDKWRDLKADEDGLFDVVITLNGKEVDVEKFINGLYRSYQIAAGRKAVELVQSEFNKRLLQPIYELEEALNHSNLMKLLDTDNE